MPLYKNILDIASKIIPRQKIQYRKYIEDEVNEYGVVIQKFSEWKDILAHVQPGIISSFGGKNINERMYHEMGLDWSRNYITVWAKVDVNTTVLNKAADQFNVNGKIFNAVMTADWIEFNGWKRIFCVERDDG